MIKLGEIMPEQMIESGYRGRRVIVAKPPEPVRAFARTQLLLGRFLPFLAESPATHHHVETLLGGAQQVPRVIFVFGTYPRREISINPTACNDAGQAMHLCAAGTRR